MNQRGFTLPELLVTILIMAALALSGYLFIHPKNDTPALQDAERQSGIAYIVQSVNRYYAKEGHLPTAITTKAAFIGSGTGNVDLCKDLVPYYASDLPLDPTLSAQVVDERCNSSEQTYLTGYLIWRNAESTLITVVATGSSGQKITISHAY